MVTKFVEIRDEMTCVPALAIQISGADGWEARRAGFGETPCIYLVMLATERCAYDPWSWGDRTMHTAHLWLSEHFDEFESGTVLDVRVLLGEAEEPVTSDRLYGR